MNYATYIVSIVGGEALKFVEVVAADIEAAKGDVRAAYGEDVDIVSIRIK